MSLIWVLAYPSLPPPSHRPHLTNKRTAHFGSRDLEPVEFAPRTRDKCSFKVL
eukprot:jgi/Botrbrau1/14054/Bobra.182_3s0001.1